ncbi:SDR family oxidoreductase [Robiginitalea sp. M366]|uniref:SDR family oxidoreductase n=1 Tax=Robiginitalea aestuariiviva TaxID=3036903 RepID=UPI00240DD18F|nr:SDR family oxidoreductase [Robiginitalea aestuariiviva]MDG1572077.1 SDR family oxidoreductase [Robiginitalea aestuariiviva]
MEISLKNKHALVGGSSKGIGRAIAEQLAACGARVTLAARSEDLLKAAVNDLESRFPAGHHYLCVDYTQASAYRNQIREYLEKDPADILVNNTQGPPAGTSLEQTPESYQQAFDLLFQSVVANTQAALPHMQKKGWGRIVNVASVSVREPLGYLALSNTMRAAVVSLGKTLASDAGPYGITVNSVLTGYFDTERLASLNTKKAEVMGITPEEVTDRLKAQVPLGRLGRPEEYGHLVAFLASDLAAYLTGAVIPLDGGLLRSY